MPIRLTKMGLIHHFKEVKGFFLNGEKKIQHAKKEPFSHNFHQIKILKFWDKNKEKKNLKGVENL